MFYLFFIKGERKGGVLTAEDAPCVRQAMRRAVRRDMRLPCRERGRGCVPYVRTGMPCRGNLPEGRRVIWKRGKR